jgi:hypothetical protein
MNDAEFGGVFALAIGTLFFASVTLCIRTSYKKKDDTSKGSCCWGCIKWENTRDVKTELDIELGLAKKPIFNAGSIEGSSDFNSDFNIESKR